MHTVDAEGGGRVFKTAWFSKRRARPVFEELCEAIQQTMKGQVDDLGGGVFKKRLNKNMHRSVIVAKGQKYWITPISLPKKIRKISTRMN